MDGAGPTAERPALLGRADLLEQIDVRLAECRGGHGSLLWLHGDAGIGKTRVLSEIVARADGAEVLRGAGWEDAGTPAFWVWSQVLRGAAAVLPLEEWGDRSERARALLDGRGGGSGDEAGRFPLFDAVAGVLDLISVRAPIVLVLDDLHWVDEGSLRLLRYIATDLASRPMLIACGWRDHDFGHSPEQRALAAEVAARGESWPLVGLGEDDVRTLITLTAGRVAGAEEARAVAARTGGNPLFVSEMARLARARGTDSLAVGVPATAQATIRRRVARLAQPAESALGAAAVLGPSLSVARLGRLLGVPPSALAGLIDDLVDAGLVTHDGDRLDFAHALIRDAVYDALPPARRRELHRSVADLVREPGHGSQSEAAEVAHHLLRALPLVEVDAVVAAAEKAARAAASVQAYEEAVRWCESALHTADPASDRRRGLLLLAGETRQSAGDLDGAREAYLEAAELGRRDGDAAYFAQAALGFAAGLSGFEVRLWDRGQTDLLEEALVRLGPDDSAARAHVLARLSVALSFSASADRRRALADEAVAIARRLTDPIALAGALAAHCDAMAGPDHVALRESEAGEIIDLAREGSDVGLELLGLRLRVIARWERGDTAAADLDVAEFDRLVDRLRQPFYGWYSTLWRGLRAHLAGDLEEMAACAVEVGRLGEIGGSRNASVLGVVQAAWPLIERGRNAEALADLEAAFGVLPELAGDGVSLIRLFAGQPRHTREAALPLFPQMLAAVSVDKEWLPNLCGVALGFWENDVGGDPARLLYETLLPWRHLCAVDGIGAALAGSVERHLGDLATLLEEYDAAEDHFERALQVNTRLGAPLAVANVRRSFAGLLARRGDPESLERRRVMLGEALAFYRRVGIAERVAEVEAALGPAPSAAPPATAPATGLLRRDGAFWTVGWRGREAVIPAVKGIADLAVLLGQPEREVHALDLVGAGAAPRSDLGEVIDPAAKEAYRKRLRVLDDELEEAEATGDVAGSEAAATEREFLLAELGAAYGLGGRARRAGDPAERARTTVTSRIRDAIARIDAELPDLGRHLRASVRTGTYCCYSPETPTVWEARPTP